MYLPFFCTFLIKRIHKCKNLQNCPRLHISSKDLKGFFTSIHPTLSSYYYQVWLLHMYRKNDGVVLQIAQIYCLITSTESFTLLP